MRICHLLSMEIPSPALERSLPNAAILACKHAIDSTPEHEHTVLLFGPQSIEDRALALGIDTTDRIACPSNDPARAETALSRYLQHRPLFDTLTCWSERTLTLWQRAGWMSLDAIGVMLGDPTGARDLDSTPVVTFDARDADAWRARGADAHLAACPRDANVPSDDDRTRWRNALGADSGEIVFALLGEPTPNTDALWVCCMMVVLEHAGIGVIGLVPADASAWSRAKRVHRNMQLRSPLVRLDGPMHETIAMCDMAICGIEEDSPWRGANAMMIERAHAAGVAVLGGPALAELADYPLLAREHCLARSTKPTVVAGRVSALGESRMLRRRLRTSLMEHKERESPGLADTLSSIWAHAPARRRPMVVS